jgi:hypothetical protein
MLSKHYIGRCKVVPAEAVSVLYTGTGTSTYVRKGNVASLQCSGSEIRDPVLFYPLDPGSGSGMNFFRVPDPRGTVCFLVRFS